ncbi:flavin reductase family protein [Psychrobacter sp. T6-1]|uniref:flavin reductase family protein n=1 Tax=Psychrobacter sp. T6-1 TaxID=3457447 RepID=UPI003FD1F0E4
MSTGYHPELIQRAFIDFVGTRVHPFWSLTSPKLRLLAKHRLGDNLVALQFETNYAFRQQSGNNWDGGQHLSLIVPIDGVRHQRQYSIVGLPQQPLWWHSKKVQTLTIAIKAQGLVSQHLTQQAALGDVFECSTPSGSFILPSALDDSAPILCIASGSGITPMLGLITQALKSGRTVTLLHYNRTPILTSFWSVLASTYPAFRYHLIITKDSSTYLASSRHLNTQSLLSLGLPLEQTQVYACGAQELLSSLYQAASEIDLDDVSLRDNITVERFGSSDFGYSKEQSAADIVERTISLRARQRQFTSDTTLLAGAEKAGIRLPYGCRQGICHLCRCQKISGQVKNIQTGSISSDGFESIQTCITVPLTDVVLDV